MSKLSLTEYGKYADGRASMLGGLRAIGGGTVSGREGVEEDKYYHVSMDKWNILHQGGGTLTGMRGTPLTFEDMAVPLEEQPAEEKPVKWGYVAAGLAILGIVFYALWKR